MKPDDETFELPADVKNAGHANRRIAAVKLPREQRNSGLKRAKGIVDADINENRNLVLGRCIGLSGP